ncbi:hypothetical protein V3C99_003783, partial [Haemonchus contortus]
WIQPQSCRWMFKQLIEEQRNLASTMMKEQRDIIAKIMDRAPERDQGAAKPKEQVTLPNVMAALSNRIEKFIFDPDADMSFSKWFSRYKEVFSEDAKQLTETNRVRLLCERLDSVIFDKYQRHVLPRDVSQIGFDETVEALKLLFDHKTSLFTTRYQCLKLEKNDAEDYLTYTGRVNEFCEKAKIHELNSDGIKCLLWNFGLKSQQEADIRLMRWATILLGYDFDIEYVKTTQFGHVDGLSRLMQKHQDADEDVVVAAVENVVSMLLKDCIRRLPLTHEDVRDSTTKDFLLRKIMSNVRSGKWQKVNSRLSPYFNRRETLSIVDGCLMIAERVVIPGELQAQVLRELHVGHPGIVRMKKLARSYV